MIDLNINSLYSKAKEECKKDNTFRLNFGVYFTPEF